MNNNNLSAEWDGGENTSETLPKTEPATGPAGSPATTVPQAQKTELPLKPIPTMPPHDEKFHTVTPTPAATHPGIDLELPQHQTQIQQQILAQAEPIPETYRELLLEHRRLQNIFDLHHGRILILPNDKFLATKFRMDTVCKKLHEVQQGSRETFIGSIEYGKLPHNHPDSMKRERMEILARQMPEVAELIAERDVLASKARN